MTSREIVQLVPSLDPFSGVASHATALARGLEEQAGLRTSFVAPDGGATRSAESLHRELACHPGSPVVLHYSNYGYQRRGCPRWLLDGLTHWRAESPAGRLVTVFHEVYATGRPWESSFWLSPIQRHLATRLQRLSDAAVTSLERYGETLRAWKATTVAILPVFSTVGEPATAAPLAARRRRLVVFGSAGLRARAYSTGGRDLARACAAMDVEEILDVGPARVAPPMHASVPVRALGEQPADAVSAILADSVAGFLQYPQEFLGKSTVFAAFAAHRLVPICSWPSRNGTASAHFWSVRQDCAGDWQDLADGAHRWYQDHSISRHATLYAALLQ